VKFVKVKNMVKELNNIIMAINIMVIILMENLMDTDNIYGIINLLIEEILKMELGMEKVYFFKKVIDIKANT
jgi:hypothetical protein